MFESLSHQHSQTRKYRHLSLQLEEKIKETYNEVANTIVADMMNDGLKELVKAKLAGAMMEQFTVSCVEIHHEQRTKDNVLSFSITLPR